MSDIYICYHYIRNDTDLHALSIKEFEQQLISFSEDTENNYIATFDDGLKDGYNNAYPLLEKYDIPYIFFIPTQILIDHRVLQVQKRHLLLAKLGTEKVVQEFNGLIDDVFKVDDGCSVKGVYDDVLTSSLKYVLDYVEHTKSKNVLNTLFDLYFDEDKVFDEIYLTIEQMKELKKLGLHGHRHIRLGTIPFKMMKDDLCCSVDAFKETFGYATDMISYPFGSYNIFTKRLVSDMGIKYGITVEKRPNNNGSDKLALGRYDANDFLKQENKLKVIEDGTRD